MNNTTFDKLCEPLLSYLTSESAKIDEQSGSRKLLFTKFVKSLIFYYVYKLDSLRSLVTTLKTDNICKKLGLPFFAKSTFQDGFYRFNSKHFKGLYEHLLRDTSLLRVPEIASLGQISLVDGSLFPTLKSMDWATYKETKNAIRLHLSFHLNQMLPTEFWVAAGNSSERTFLLKILKEGFTYVADRGYFSFEVIEKIAKAKAFYVLRIKKNALYKVLKNNSLPDKLPVCFKNVTDENIVFTNDKQQSKTRLVTFKVSDSQFYIITNRFDLTTLQIIMIYAYRWQIELLFKFIKRTLGGIHLINHSQNGVTIQFYVLMIVALLQMKLKQSCEQEKLKIQDENKLDTISKTSVPKSKPNAKVQKKEHTKEPIKHIKEQAVPLVSKQYIQPNTWIQYINSKVKNLWKMPKQWLNKLKNLLSNQFNENVINILNE